MRKVSSLEKSSLSFYELENDFVIEHLWSAAEKRGSMGEIRFISTATVAQRRKPNESTQRIDLNPWELRYLLFVPIQRAFSFESL